MFHIDTIKVISLIHNIQENRQLKAGRLRNFTIACNKFKYTPVYECGGKFIWSLFKEYKDALPEDKGSIGLANFHDIVKLLTLRGESKSGVSTYDIKFHYGNNLWSFTWLDWTNEYKCKFFHQNYWFYKITEEIMAQSLWILSIGIW